MLSLRLLVGTAILVGACGSPTASPPSPSGAEGVTQVIAKVRGITCPACGAVAEMALRQRLADVTGVSISQGEQTVSVRFAPGGGEFSPVVFREAVAEAGIDVLSLDIDACGLVEEATGQRWLVTGANRFVLDDGGGTPTGRLMCVSGALNDRSVPYRVTPTAIHALTTEPA